MSVAKLLGGVLTEAEVKEAINEFYEDSKEAALCIVAETLEILEGQEIGRARRENGESE